LNDFVLKLCGYFFAINQLIPPTPFSWKKEKGEWKEVAKIHNANSMEENGNSPSLPSKRGI